MQRDTRIENKPALQTDHAHMQELPVDHQGCFSQARTNQWSICQCLDQLGNICSCGQHGSTLHSNASSIKFYIDPHHMNDLNWQQIPLKGKFDPLFKNQFTPEEILGLHVHCAHAGMGDIQANNDGSLQE